MTHPQRSGGALSPDQTLDNGNLDAHRGRQQPGVTTRSLVITRAESRRRCSGARSLP